MLWLVMNWQLWRFESQSLTVLNLNISAKNSFWKPLNKQIPKLFLWFQLEKDLINKTYFDNCCNLNKVYCMYRKSWIQKCNQEMQTKITNLVLLRTIIWLLATRRLYLLPRLCWRREKPRKFLLNFNGKTFALKQFFFRFYYFPADYKSIVF